MSSETYATLCLHIDTQVCLRSPVYHAFIDLCVRWEVCHGSINENIFAFHAINFGSRRVIESHCILRVHPVYLAL